MSFCTWFKEEQYKDHFETGEFDVAELRRVFDGDTDYGDVRPKGESTIVISTTRKISD